MDNENESKTRALLIENRILTTLHAKVNNYDMFSFSNLRSVVEPQKEVYTPGDTFKAKVYLSAYNEFENFHPSKGEMIKNDKGDFFVVIPIEKNTDNDTLKYNIKFKALHNSIITEMKGAYEVPIASSKPRQKHK